MGFTDADYENVVKNNPEIHKGSFLFSRDKVIRMAGNSIPVKLLEGIFLQIKMLDEESWNLFFKDNNLKLFLFSLSEILLLLLPK